MHNMVALLRFSSCLAVVWLLACSQSPSEVGTNGGGTEIVCIVGSAADTSGVAVAGATVRIRRIDYIPTPSLYKTGLFSADAATDESGAFRIQNLDTGTYMLEILDTILHIGRSFVCTVFSPDTQIVLGRMTLMPTGTIHGKIQRRYQLDPARINVLVYGLDRSSFTDTAGDYYLRDIPRGTYSLRMVSESRDYLPYNLDNVYVGREGSNEAGQFNWPMKGPGIDSADSAALRAILDSNGLYAVPLQQVMSFDPVTRRITELRLHYLRIHTLTPRIGDLEHLRSLNAERDSLVSVPSTIGRLKRLRSLNLRANWISVLPAEIGNLDSLQILDVSMNRLVMLPGEMGALHLLTLLNTGGNELVALPAELGDCAALGVVQVMCNRLTTLPADLGRLSRLNFLDVQFNHIDSLPSPLFVLGSSTPFVINISENRLGDSIPDAAAAWLDLHSANADWRRTQQHR